MARRGSPYPQLAGRRDGMALRTPTSRGLPTCASPYSQLEEPRRGVRFHIPNLRGLAKAWEFEPSCGGAAPRHGSPYPQLKWPCEGKAWESLSPTRGAMPRRGVRHTPPEGPRQSVGVCVTNSRAPRRRSAYPQVQGPWQGVGVHFPNPRILP